MFRINRKVAPPKQEKKWEIDYSEEDQKIEDLVIPTATDEELGIEGNYFLLSQLE